MKALTLRLDADDGAVLELLARVDRASQTDVLRRALREHAKRRLRDPDVARRVAHLHAEETRVLDRAVPRPTASTRSVT